jgi:hypothetical protein
MLKVGRRTNRRYRRNIRHVGGGYDRSGATRLCPTRRDGDMPAAAIAFAAARRSSTSDAKFTGSPVPPPIPVPAKSNLKTPMPARDSARDVNSGATVFPAREAVGEDRPAPRRPFRRFEVRRASPTDKRK